MKKISTYYFIVLAILNGFLIPCMLWFLGFMSQQFNYIAEGQRLPAATERFLSFPSWPSVFMALSLVGVAVSIWTKIKSSTLYHAIIVMLVLEALILCLGMLTLPLTLTSLLHLH